MDALDAYDLFRHAQRMAERLTATQKMLEGAGFPAAERGWLAQARQLLELNLPKGEALIARGRFLPELVDVRDEFAERFQQDYVDALEKLHAGFTFHAGSRAPIIETLFPHLKFAALRRMGREGLCAFHSEYQRRLRLSYVQRMLTTEDFGFATAVLEKVDRAYFEWDRCFGTEFLSEPEATELRGELSTFVEALELSLHQARLLSEAALAPLPGSFEEQGLSMKMRKSRRARPLSSPREDLSDPLNGGGEATPALTANDASAH